MCVLSICFWRGVLVKNLVKPQIITSYPSVIAWGYAGYVFMLCYVMFCFLHFRQKHKAMLFLFVKVLVQVTFSQLLVLYIQDWSTPWLPLHFFFGYILRQRLHVEVLNQKVFNNSLLEKRSSLFSSVICSVFCLKLFGHFVA